MKVTTEMHYEFDDIQFGLFYEKNVQLLYRMAFHILHDHGKAEDALQEALLKLYKARKKIDSEIMAFRWAKIMVRNEAINLYYKNRRLEPISPDEIEILINSTTAPSNIENIILQKEDLEQLYLALQKMPKKFSEVIRFRYFDDIPPKEIAAMLQIPLFTVYSRLRRGLELLKGGKDYGEK